MTDAEKDEGQVNAEKAPGKREQIAAAAKTLKASGFNQEQIADQLSLKFAVTKDEVAAALAQGDGEQDDDEKKPADA